MAKIRAQYDEYIGQFTYDDEEMTSLYDTDAKSIIDSLSRDTDPLALLLNSGDFD